MRRSLIAVLIGAAALGGCASEAQFARGTAPARPALEAMLADAERALAAGQAEQAQAAFKAAAAGYPAEKAPWLQLAQYKFERAAYGEAVLHAQEALQRDPLDKQAHSIIAVSGLRLATRALAELSQQSNLGGPVKSEAQELARLLRSTLGEEVLVPPPGAARVARKPPPGKGAVQSKPVPSPSNSADPFGALK